MKKLHLGYYADGKPIYLDPDDRKTHMHVPGSSGSGKSKFLEWMMRGDLGNRQGFCLIDPHGKTYNDILSYCAHHVLDRDIILLNLSQPDSIIGFNPFQKAPTGNTAVQVDNRITATLHAWNVTSADQTPTLERTMRLIYTIMLECDLGLPQVQHLIDFNAQDLRADLIERLPSSLVQKEWRELNQLRSREWREETLSAKNRFFRFLNSPTLGRFMGVPGRSLNLKEIMDEGKILLVNVAPSDDLSRENARVFGSLLVNEFFEYALRRKPDERGHDPKPYYLYMDEFQRFVSLDIADMLDEVRKFGLFLILSHQRFGHLNADLMDAVLTNCKLRAVFGGLKYEDACLLANEMFLPDLNSRQIKKAYHHTIHVYEEEQRTIDSHGSGEGSSQGTTWSEGHGRGTSDTKGSSWSSGVNRTDGVNSTSASVISSGTSFAAPGIGVGQPAVEGWYGQSDGRSSVSSHGTSNSVSEFVANAESESSTRSESESLTEGGSTSRNEFTSRSESKVPVWVPIPVQELNSEIEWSREEKVSKVAEMLKYQQTRHCFIKIHNQKTEPLLVPSLKTFHTSQKNRDWYKQGLMAKHDALPATEVDDLIEDRERALLKAPVSEPIDVEVVATTHKPKRRTRSARDSLSATIKKSPWSAK